MAANASQIKIQTQPTKPKPRRFRETTISSSATAVTDDSVSTDSHLNREPRKLDSPTVVSPDNSWCCPVSKTKEMDSSSHFTPTAYGGGDSSVSAFPSSFTKFNSALTAGLLNPMSPPPSVDKTRSSPTLFEMMANEPDCLSRSQIPATATTLNTQRTQISAQDKHALMQQRLSELLYCRSPGNLFNDEASSDTKLTLRLKDGLIISMNVHRQILVAHSRFFAVKLSERWSRQQPRSPNPYVVEISDCDDVEVYIETLRLMYCKDLRKKLMREDVSKVLGILKVSAAIGFDAGVLSCLEYLEAAPWAEDEEEKVASLLSELRLEGVGAIEVLKRVSVDVGNNADEDGGSDNEGVLLKLLHVVLDGKDEKARREMKGLVSKMLRENSSQNDLKKESLYSSIEGCLQSLRKHVSRTSEVAKIARQADNLHWILEILIDRQMADDFLKIWISQSEIAEFHTNVAPIHRFEISRVTARLFVGIGKGQLLASKDDRCKLLRIWLVPFYEDFGWMRRASKGLDRHLIEDGLSNTILTLPLAWQQEFFMSWFDRFLNAADDCPNIQRGFEVWWRRAFWRRNGEPDQQRPQQMRILTPSLEKC